MLINFFFRLVKILTNLSKPSFLYLKNKFYTFYANNLNKTYISILIGSIIISLYYIIEYLLFPLDIFIYIYISVSIISGLLALLFLNDYNYSKNINLKTVQIIIVTGIKFLFIIPILCLIPDFLS